MNENSWSFLSMSYSLFSYSGAVTRSKSAQSLVPFLISSSKVYHWCFH